MKKAQRADKLPQGTKQNPAGSIRESDLAEGLSETVLSSPSRAAGARRIHAPNDSIAGGVSGRAPLADGDASAVSFERGPAAGQAPTRGWFRYPHRIVSWFLAASTGVALSIAALLWSFALSDQWTILSAAAVLGTFGVLFTHGYFRVNMANEGSLQLRLATGASAVGVTAALFVVSLPGLDQPEAPTFVALMAMLVLSAVGGRGLARAIIRQLWRRGYLRASALVYGTDDLAREVAIEIGHRRAYGVDIAGFIAPSFLNLTTSGEASEASLPAPVFPSRNSVELARQDFAAAVKASGANRLIVGPAAGPDDTHPQQVARWAVASGMAVHVVPRFYQMGLGLDSMSPDRARGYPLVRLQRSAHPQLSIRLKRLMDIVVASAVLIIGGPLMLAVAATVKLTSPGPVLFAQERIGQHNETIVIRKFRSMTVNSKSDTEWNAQSRITPVGRWLRRLNIDELPQLYSIVIGDMSLVGPRPERPAFVERFKGSIPDYNDRHRSPVGLTGLAQVVGLRGDTSIAERVKYDNLYIDQWSLRADLEILVRTLSAILFQRGKAQTAIALELALAEDPTSRS